MDNGKWTGKEIKRLRKILGMNQSEFADALGITQGRVSELESGKTEAWGLLSRCLDYYSELCRRERESPMVVDDGTKRTQGTGGDGE